MGFFGGARDWMSELDEFAWGKPAILPDFAAPYCHTGVVLWATAVPLPLTLS